MYLGEPGGSWPVSDGLHGGSWAAWWRFRLWLGCPRRMGQGSGSGDGEVGDCPFAYGEALFEVGDATGEVTLQADSDDPYIAGVLSEAGQLGCVGVFGRGALPPRADGLGAGVGVAFVGDGRVRGECLDGGVVVAALVCGEVGADRCGQWGEVGRHGVLPRSWGI